MANTSTKSNKADREAWEGIYRGAAYSASLAVTELMLLAIEMGRAAEAPGKPIDADVVRRSCDLRGRLRSAIQCADAAHAAIVRDTAGTFLKDANGEIAKVRAARKALRPEVRARGKKKLRTSHSRPRVSARGARAPH